MNKQIAVLNGLRLGTCTLAIVGFMSAANAQENCSCLLPTAAAGTQIGTLQSVDGNVRVSLPSGYGAAAQGTPLYQNSRVLVGPNSTAALSLGQGCEITAAQNSTVEIVPQASAICVAMTGDAALAPAQAGVAGGALSAGPSITPFMLFTGLAGSAALLSAVSDSDDGPAVSQ